MCSIGDIVLIEKKKDIKQSRVPSKKGYKKNYIITNDKEYNAVLVIDHEYVNGVEGYYYLKLIEYKFGNTYDDHQFIKINSEMATNLGLNKPYLLDVSMIYRSFDDYIKAGQCSSPILVKLLNKFVDYQEHKRKCEQYYLVKASTRRQIEKANKATEDDKLTNNTLNQKNVSVGDLIWVKKTVLKPNKEIDKMHPAIVISVDPQANEFYYVLATSSPTISLADYKKARKALDEAREEQFSVEYIASNYTARPAYYKLLMWACKYFPMDFSKCNATQELHDGYINVEHIYKKSITIYDEEKKRHVVDFIKIGEVNVDCLARIFKEIIFLQEILNRTTYADDLYGNVKPNILKQLGIEKKKIITKCKNIY